MWRMSQRIWRSKNPVNRVICLAGVGCLCLLGAETVAQAQTSGCEPSKPGVDQGLHDIASGVQGYQLGPGDKVSIHVLDEDEVEDKPYAIDLNGGLTLPRLGTVQVAGLTVTQLQKELTECFRVYLKSPVVTVSVAEFSSQPVTVLGAVANPGVRQIEGRKTLFEIISEAGGLKEDAGNTIRITRQLQYGPLPLPNSRLDLGGKFSVAEVTVASIVKADNPAQNIPILPHDVITVPKAEMVYVVGAVHKAGGFVLSERSDMSVLELLSLAEGMDRTAGGKNAKILRASDGPGQRTEVPINLNRIIQGKSPDVSLRGDDILFVPNSTGKSATLRAIEAIVSTGSGVAIYHPY